MAIKQNEFFIRTDKIDEVVASLELLTKTKILVGIPATLAGRQDEDGKFGPVNNAMIAYINEFGSPAQNIPPRPFLIPGVTRARERVINYLKQGMQATLKGDKTLTIRAMMAAGQVAADSAKNVIREGAFIPLSMATLVARANRNTTTGRAGSRKGAVLELANRAAGVAPSTEFAKPLYDTGALLKSISYVLRGKWE